MLAHDFKLIRERFAPSRSLINAAWFKLLSSKGQGSKDLSCARKQTCLSNLMKVHENLIALLLIDKFIKNFILSNEYVLDTYYSSLMS